MLKSVDDYILAREFDADRSMPGQAIPKAPSAKESEFILDANEEEGTEDEEDDNSEGIVDE